MEPHFRRLYLHLIVFLLAAVVFMPHSACADHDTIRLTSGDWPPYFSRTLPHGGIGAQIYTEAFALEGVKVVFEYQPWKRGYDSARYASKFDGTAGWRRIPAREKLFYFSDPLFSAQTVFFHTLGDDFDWNIFGDVGDNIVGATLGYAYTDLLKPAMRSGRVEEAPTDRLNFEKLQAGRIEIFPCSLEVGYYILNNQLAGKDVSHIQHHPKPVIQGGIHILISKKTPHGRKWIFLFNRGLQKLKDSGRYDEIMQEAAETYGIK